MCGLYLFASHRSPQMYDLLSAYFTDRVIRLLCNGICVFKNHVVRYCGKNIYKHSGKVIHKLKSKVFQAFSLFPLYTTISHNLIPYIII